MSLQDYIKVITEDIWIIQAIEILLASSMICYFSPHNILPEKRENPIAIYAVTVPVLLKCKKTYAG